MLLTVTSLDGKASARRGSRLLTVPSGAGATRLAFAVAKRARSILPDRHRADGRARAVLWASCWVRRYHTGVHGPDCLSLRAVAVTGVGSRQWMHFFCQDAHSLLEDGDGVSKK